ncbi:MAG: pyridoxal phosphate-dependent aminotransferase [Clostridia bacterium]|nr:pyridoxal phosphate-dependent aminotransferase [Clostridia bacterium]
MNMDLYRRFDIPVDRVNTECIKWDNREALGNKDALPMWVADMDFRTADGIIDALASRVQHGIFGYAQDASLDKAACALWMKNRHNCEVKPEWLIYSPGVVDSIYHVLSAVCKPGSRVVIQPPVYGPFSAMCNKAKMQIVENPLIETENGFEIDFNGMEECFKAGADAFVFCSPHNPVGRIWKAEELQNVVELCNRYGVQMISDEIHCDFELRGQKHIPLIAIPGGENAVVLISATKTFNLAALRHSTIICPNEEIRNKVIASMSEAMTDVNLFGRLATRAAYQTGGEWLDALNEYLTDGRDILAEGINSIDGLRVHAPEGTYLMWVNAKALGMNSDQLNNFFVEKCAVIPVIGTAFGAQGEGFVRLNFATAHKNLEIALERIEKAVRAL